MALLTPTVSSPIILCLALSPSLLFSTCTTLPHPHSRTAPISLEPFASLSPPPSLTPPKPNPLSDSTCIVAIVVGAAFTLSRLFAMPSGPSPPTSSPLASSPPQTNSSSYSQLPAHRLPQHAVELAKWLDIFSGVLVVRVLLRRRGYAGSVQQWGSAGSGGAAVAEGVHRQ